MAAMTRVAAFGYVLVEAIAFWAVGRWLGYGWALLALAGLFALGVLFAAAQLRAITARALAGGRAGEGPGTIMADTALVILGCLLVALPGFVSTLAGLIAIAPPTRALIRRGLGAAALAWVQRTAGQSLTIVEHYGVRRPGAETIDMPDGVEIPDPDDFRDPPGPDRG